MSVDPRVPRYGSMRRPVSNPYKIPAKFKTLIKKFDQLGYELPVKLTGRVINNRERTLLIIWPRGMALVRDGEPVDIDGVYANRFNVHVFSFLALLQLADPKLTDEIEAFKDWLRNEDRRVKAADTLARLKANAEMAGYTLVKK